MSDEFRAGLLAQDERPENTIGDIRRFFTEGPGSMPIKQGEFIEFWQSLSDEDKVAFKTADLSK